MSIAAKSARKRGVILTTNGWNKFQNTKREFELQNNNGNRYSYEELAIAPTYHYTPFPASWHVQRR